MIIIQRFTNINLHLSVIWQASSLKSHSLYLKLIHVQQFSTSNRVVIKSQEPRGIPSATLKVTPSYFINKYKKKRPKEIPRDAWFLNLLVVLLAYINSKTGNLSDNPATWRKARGKGQEYEDKGKTSQEKNKGMKKKTPCKWVLNTRMFAWQGNSYPAMLCRQTNIALSKIFLKH